MESYPRSPEFSKSSDKEKSESDSKKEKKIGGKVAETLIKPPAEVRGDSLEPKNAESIWQRIAALAEKREIDKSILKPVENADNDSKLGTQKPDKVADIPEAEITDAGSASAASNPAETAPRTAPKNEADKTDDTGEKDLPEETDESAPLESLSKDEKRETVSRYAESRSSALKAELQELPEGAPLPVESAADLAYLAYVQKQMAENPDKPAQEVLDEAEAVLAAEMAKTENGQILETESTAGIPDASGAENLAEEAEGVPGDEAQPNEGEIPLSAENSDAEAPIILNPADDNAEAPQSAGGAGGNGGGGGGNVPPTPPGANQPPTPGSGGGNVPPSNPFRSGMPGPGMPPVPPSYSYSMAYGSPQPQQFNVAPVITDAELLAERRRAMVQGFLVGGIIGYLLGRRRGRIKTEKRLLPVQKKLEKQVKNLAETVALKEQAIRKQAAETAAKMKTLEEQRRFAERLSAAANANLLNERAEAKLHREQAAKNQSGETLQERNTEVLNAAAMHHEAQPTAVLPRAERLGRMLVEAPAAAVAAAGTGQAAENRGVTAEHIDFGKKVEDYTPRELNEAADKIRVDNVTLREIRNEHKLDDQAVRRIITAFVEGRSVREAITRELFEKDLRYERDPKYRQFETADAEGGSPRGSGGGAISAAAATAIGLAAGKGPAAGSQHNTPENTAKQYKPTPDSHTLARIRNRQIAEVSVAAAVLIAIVVAIVVLA